MVKKKKKTTKKRPLRPGEGAIADALTKMIKPAVKYHDKKQRSRVVIVGLLENNDKYRYTFYFKDGDKAKLFDASIQYVSIVKEGDPSLFFKALLKRMKPSNSNNDDFEEPDIDWEKSRARKLLYDDVNEGRVALEAKDGTGKKTTDYSYLYYMHPEYASWDFDAFPRRLAGIRKIIKNKNARAEDDQAAFDKFVENNEISIFSHQGFIQWQGSDAQKLLKKDIKNGVLEKYTKDKYKHPKMEYWLSRPEFYDEFPLNVFRDKIRQEIRTGKYWHTMKVKGKTETYKYNN